MPRDAAAMVPCLHATCHGLLCHIDTYFLEGEMFGKREKAGKCLLNIAGRHKRLLRNALYI